MAYNKINWVDYPQTDTPITASNLNKMDNEIYEQSLLLEAIKNNLFIFNASEKKLIIDLDALK